MRLSGHLRCLLHALAFNGVRLRADGDRLLFDAPPGVLTPEVLALIRLEKPAILREIHWIQDATAELDRRKLDSCKASS